MGYNELINNLVLHSQNILKKVEQQESFFLICNSTVDGLLSSAMVFKSIYNLNGHVKLRCYPTCEKNFIDFIEKIGLEKQDYHIFIDFSSEKFQSISEKVNDDKFLFLNSDIDTTFKRNKGDSESKSTNYLNPWLHLEKNKNNSITTAGLTYLLVRSYDRTIHKMAYMPVIAAISKNLFDKKNGELYGLDKEILKTALDLHLVEKRKSFTFGDIDNSTIVEVLENNITHFIKDITWNRDEIYNILKKSNITFTNGKKIKTVKELDENELSKILDVIEKSIEKSSPKMADIFRNRGIDNDLNFSTFKNLNEKNPMVLNERVNTPRLESDSNDQLSKNAIRNTLFNNNYILVNEEENSLLKNVRTFSKVLDTCIRNRKEGFGLSICIGERKDSMEEMRIQITEQNDSIKQLCSKIFSEKWRFHDEKNAIFINGEGLITEKNQELFISFLKNSISYSNKLICLRTLTAEEEDEDYKYIITNTPYSKINLDKIKHTLRESFSLTVDNTKSYLELDGQTVQIKVSIMKLEDFLSNIKRILLDATTSGSDY